MDSNKKGRRRGVFSGRIFPDVSDYCDRICSDQRLADGDKTVLIIDSLHQYLPFYTDMHNRLVEGKSLLYSFSGGLGYNFWSTYAYYLASPLNFLMVLIPTENVCDFMDLMILLKIALCGGCFSWYLHKRDENRSICRLYSASCLP